MNQEWDCTPKAIAQIMIVFSLSIYDELKTQNLYFIKVALTRLICTATCWQAHWTRWSSLHAKFVQKETPNFNQAGGDVSISTNPLSINVP